MISKSGASYQTLYAAALISEITLRSLGDGTKAAIQSPRALTRLARCIAG